MDEITAGLLVALGLFSVGGAVLTWSPWKRADIAGFLWLFGAGSLVILVVHLAS